MGLFKRTGSSPAMIKDVEKAYCCAKIKTATTDANGDVLFTTESGDIVKLDISGLPDYADNATAHAAIGADKLFIITSTGAVHRTFTP